LREDAAAGLSFRPEQEIQQPQAVTLGILADLGDRADARRAALLAATGLRHLACRPQQGLVQFI